MTRFVESVDREQGALFPERLEDWIEADNPVRALLKNSSYPGWALAEWPPKRRADLHIVPRCC